MPDERIVLVNALGTHRPQTEAELMGMLGSAVVNHYRIVQQRRQHPVVGHGVGRDHSTRYR